MTCRHPKAARAARVIADRLVTACWACEVEREIWRAETFPRSLDTPIGYTELDGMSVTPAQFDTVRTAPAISSSLIRGRRSFSGG